MSHIVPFSFDASQVRVVTDDRGEPWFVAKDVAEALEYSWQSNTIKHVPDEWKGVTPITTPGGIQQMAVLSEQGLYFFVSRSDKPKALPFQKWLAGEVLPSIRKTGSYSIPPTPPVPRLYPTVGHAVLEHNSISWSEASKVHNTMQTVVEMQARENGITDNAEIIRLKVDEAELVNLTVVGMTSGKYRQWYDVKRPIRASMPGLLLAAYSAIGSQNTILIRADIPYSQRAVILEQTMIDRFPLVVAYRNEQLSTIAKRIATNDYNLFPVAPLDSSYLRVPDEVLLRLGFSPEEIKQETSIPPVLSTSSIASIMPVAFANKQ